MEELNYFTEGWKHIISWGALDHQLFILALAILYTVADWRRVLILVTAFTVGHSLTLALSAYEVLNINSDLVEFFIPCTIAITAGTNFVYKDFQSASLRLNYLLALLFGLIHGLGFANFIRFTLAGDQSIAWPLLQFNLGLEVGQVVFVSFILALNYVVLSFAGMKRRWWIWFISAVVFLLALNMIFQRFPY